MFLLKNRNQIQLTMFESFKTIAWQIVMEKDCLIMSDLKNSFTVFEIKENWDNKPGEVNLGWKFECYEKDTVTAINCVKIIKEPG